MPKPRATRAPAQDRIGHGKKSVLWQVGGREGVEDGGLCPILLLDTGPRIRKHYY